MSNISITKTKLMNTTNLLKALKALGRRFEQGHLHVSGYGGRRTPVDITVQSEESGNDIGFRKEGEDYVCVADWSGVRGIDQQAFLQNLTQQYAAIAAKEQMQAQGFALAEERRVEGRIHLILRRMA
jgi:Protein of unknown function (DUF1257)